MIVLLTGRSLLDAIHATGVENLSVMPSNIDLVGAEIEMLDRHDREKILKGILGKICR